jgi:hypothetical protein
LTDKCEEKRLPTPVSSCRTQGHKLIIRLSSREVLLGDFRGSLSIVNMDLQYSGGHIKSDSPYDFIIHPQQENTVFLVSADHRITGTSATGTSKTKSFRWAVHEFKDRALAQSYFLDHPLSTEEHYFGQSWNRDGTGTIVKAEKSTSYGRYLIGMRASDSSSATIVEFDIIHRRFSCTDYPGLNWLLYIMEGEPDLTLLPWNGRLTHFDESWRWADIEDVSDNFANGIKFNQSMVGRLLESTPEQQTRHMRTSTVLQRRAQSSEPVTASQNGAREQGTAKLRIMGDDDFVVAFGVDGYMAWSFQPNEGWRKLEETLKAEKKCPQ